MGKIAVNPEVPLGGSENLEANCAQDSLAEAEKPVVGSIGGFRERGWIESLSRQGHGEPKNGKCTANQNK